MEFTFLGTSSGVPHKNRNVSSLALRSSRHKRWYMVDCGEGTVHQLLRCKYSINKLVAIFITHLHGDHCYGLPGILASASMSGRTAPLTLVAPAAVIEMIRAVQKTTQLWLDFELIFIATEQQHARLCMADFEVELTPLSHRVPCWAYTFIESDLEQHLDKDKLAALAIDSGPLWGQLQKGLDVCLDNGQVIHPVDVMQQPRKPRVVTVCGDNDQPDLLDNISVKPDVVIHESTYCKTIAAKVGPAVQHSYAGLVARYAERAKLTNLILTHFSPRYGDNPSASLSIGVIEAEAREHFSGTLYLANDFDCYVLDKKGGLRLQ